MAPDVTPEMADFLKLYQAEYGKAPDTSMVATGWDAVQVFAQAATKAGTTEGAALAKTMEDTEFNLLTGKLKWSSATTGHEPNIEAPLVELKEGKPSFIGWVRPADVAKPAYLIKYMEKNK
jgi:branched-chain amino acid transport system substrate-binding protein